MELSTDNPFGFLAADGTTTGKENSDDTSEWGPEYGGNLEDSDRYVAP